MKREQVIFFGVVSAVLIVLVCAPVALYFTSKSTAPEPVDVGGKNEQSKKQPIVVGQAPVALEKQSPEAAFREYAKKIELAVRAGDAPKANLLFAANQIAQREVDAAPVPAVNREMIRAIINKQPTAVADGFIALEKSGGKFSFVNVTGIDDAPRLLFRVVQPNGAFSYVEVFVRLKDDGDIKVLDIYPFLSGEKMSQGLYRMVISAAAVVDPRSARKLTPDETMKLENADKISTVMFMIQQGQKAEAYAVYAKLPNELKKDRMIQTMGLTAAQDAGQKEYMEELERFQTNHPNDPAIDLIAMDHFALKKEFKRARECLERLDKKIGGDPFLLIRRGRTYSEEGRYAEAKIDLEKAIERDSTLGDAYWDRALVAAIERNHAETLTWLKKYCVTFDASVEEATLRRYDKLDTFLLSPEFEEFKRWNTERVK